MKRFLILVLVLSSFALYSKTIIEVTANKKKPNGKSWDIFRGKPDIYIVINGVSYKSQVCKNSYTCEFMVTDLKKSSTITVVDKDVKVNDSIQPNIVYTKLKNVLEIELVNSKIKDNIEDIYNHKQRKKADSVEFILTILTIVSLAAAILSMNTHYRASHAVGKISDFNVFFTFGNLVFLGLVAFFTLIIYLYNNKEKIKNNNKKQ